jgi:hypothetical protein
MRVLGEFSLTITGVTQLQSTVPLLFSAVQGFQSLAACPLLLPTMETMLIGLKAHMEVYLEKSCSSSSVTVPSAKFEWIVTVSISHPVHNKEQCK